MKSQLYKLQTDFTAAIRFKDEAATQALPINETNGITKETRLEVYSYAYWIRIANSLREDFPRLYKAFGDKDEVYLKQFITECRPSYHLLGEVSSEFAQFIARIRPDLKETAELEFTILLSEMTPWPYELEKYELRIIKPEQLGELEAENIEILWSTSALLSNTKIIAQVDDSTEILEPTTKVLQLCKLRDSISNFTALLETIENLNFDPEETAAAISFLTQNEIIYFAQKN